MQFDWGGEYEHLNSYFCKLDITHQVSCPHTHQKMVFLSESTDTLLRWV
jgi:hypothetical protein